MTEMKICPKCKTENPKAANFCRKCRYEFPEATKEGLSLKPGIKYFRIRESQYVVGSTIHLEWEADNYTKFELAGEDVTLSKEKEIVVEKTVEIQLIASNDYDQAQQSVRITPLSSPNIRSFSASRTQIKAGNTVRLSWNTINAKKITLKDGYEDADVTMQTSIELSPMEDATYTLIAYAFDEAIYVSKEISVRVLQEVSINDFSSDTQQTLESQAIELRWDVTSADKLMLFPNNLDVTHQKSIRLFPATTTTFTLIASNAISQKQQMLTVSVQRLPRLDVKVSESLSKLQIPTCNIDLTSLTGSIAETGLDRWMISPTEQGVSKKIWSKSLWQRLKKLLPKWTKL
ncbi:MAG: zinc ribbon domain-containing protein [Candidatus Cryptobacteroides sp.]